MPKATKKTTKKKATPTAKKASPTVKKAASITAKKATSTITVDRRNPTPDRRAKSEPITAGTERRKVQRRRQIDPTTCERDYSDAEVEFMRAMDDYKRASGRMFPTCSEILEVIGKLGYEKRSSQPVAGTLDQVGAQQPDNQPTAMTPSAPPAVMHLPADEVMEPHAV